MVGGRFPWALGLVPIKWIFRQALVSFAFVINLNLLIPRSLHLRSNSQMSYVTI